MPGLLRGVARTAVIAGTATSVSNRVSRRQANRWAQQGTLPEPEPAYEPAPAAAPAPAPAADPIAQLKDLADLHTAGVLTDEEFAVQKAKILGSDLRPRPGPRHLLRPRRPVRRRASSTGVAGRPGARRRRRRDVRRAPSTRRRLPHARQVGERLGDDDAVVGAPAGNARSRGAGAGSRRRRPTRTTCATCAAWSSARPRGTRHRRCRRWPARRRARRGARRSPR